MSRPRLGGTHTLTHRCRGGHPLGEVTDPIQQDERQEAESDQGEEETAHGPGNMGKGRATPPAALAQGREDA
jgi:hypothetical protein